MRRKKQCARDRHIEREGEIARKESELLTAISVLSGLGLVETIVD